MSDTITVNLSSYPENVVVNLTTESSGVTANLVETTLTFLQGAGLYRPNVFTEDNTFQQNLSVVGDLTVNGTTVIPNISGNTALSGNLTITGNESITGNLSVTGSVSVDNVTFDQTPELAGGVGVLRWNDADGTLDLGLKGGNVTLQLGQEQIVRVVNKTGADLLESEYKVVRIRLASEGGAQGQRLAVVLAQGDGDPDSVTTLGVVTENIANNEEGFITTMGLVRGINTTGSLQGETWVDGDVLYLSPTVAGGLTKVKPQAPNHTVTVAYVEYAHQNNGKLFVKIDNGYELDELHNVLITNVQDGQVLTYNSLSGVWKNADPTGGGGGDFLPLSGGTITGNLTVNGVLSADSTTGVKHTIKGNLDILGTGSNQLFVDYQNSITLNGDSSVNLNANSGYVTISGANGVNIDAGGTGLDVDGNLNLDGTFTALSGANVTGNLALTGNANITGSLSASGSISSPDFSVTGTDGELKTTTDVRTWAIGTKTYSVNPPESVPRGLDFKPDGMMFYIIGQGASRPAYAFTLSTAWDITTVTGNVSQSIGTFDSSCQEIYLSKGDGTNDGKYMYIVGDSGNKIGRWTLGTPWDITSVSSTSPDTGQNLVLTGLVATLTNPNGVFFSPDGKKMFISNGVTNSSSIFQFDLNVPWSLASGNVTYTAGNTLSVNTQETNVAAVVLNSDGTRLFITGLTSDRIHEYSLPTPYSLVGATYVGRSATAMGPELEPCGLYYNDIVNKCFIVGNSQDFVREVNVTPQPLLKGTRPLILANPTSIDDRVSINSLRITDTTTAGSNSLGLDGALVVNGGIGASTIVCAGGIVGSGLRVDSTGNLTFNTRSQIQSPAAGIFTFGTSPTLNDFNMLQLGPSGVSYPAIKRNGTGVDIVRSDQTTAGSTPLSGFTNLRAKDITATGPVVFPNVTVSGLAAYSGANYTGAMVYVTNEIDGPTMAFYDGTNWRRVQDRAIVSEIP